MRQTIFLASLLTLLLLSCKKENAQSSITGQWTWTIQYTNNPAYNSTPQSTGIQETISFNTNGTYSFIQNNAIVNSGTYKISSVTNTIGEKIESISYTNSRVTDSVTYYKLLNEGDNLMFSYDLIGTVGSGARYYVRK